MILPRCGQCLDILTGLNRASSPVLILPPAEALRIKPGQSRLERRKKGHGIGLHPLSSTCPAQNFGACGPQPTWLCGLAALGRTCTPVGWLIYRLPSHMQTRASKYVHCPHLHTSLYRTAFFLAQAPAHVRTQAGLRVQPHRPTPKDQREIRSRRSAAGDPQQGAARLQNPGSHRLVMNPPAWAAASG